MIRKIFNSLNKDNKEVKEVFVVGLGVGLVVGFVAGLVAGLGMAGLVVGLGVGLVAGLGMAGLGVGLGVGLVVGLGNLGQLIDLNHLVSVLCFIIAVFILMELIFAFEPKEKKKPNLWKVLWYKIIALFESLLIIVNLLNINGVLNKISWRTAWPEILKWIGYIGAILICIGLILFIGYWWLKLNQKIITKQTKNKKVKGEQK